MDPSTQMALSNAISFVTITSCLFLKVPQILSVKERRSAAGLDVLAMSMEITGYSLTTLYNIVNNYSLITYLEYPIILIQGYILMYYTLQYKRMLHWVKVHYGIMLYFGIVLSFLTGYLPAIILTYLVTLSTPLSGVSKIMYVFEMIKSNNAEAVSVATWSISVVTNFFRIYTVYIDSADSRLMFNFLVSTFLSCFVLVVTIYYQKYGYQRPPTGQPRRKPSYRRFSETEFH